MRAIRVITAVQAAACFGVSLAAIGAAGAGPNALVVQSLAAVIALGLALVVMRFWRKADWRYWPLIAACALALLLTLMTGVELQGARRWLAAGPVQLHTASLVLPLAAWAFARGFNDRRVAPLAAAVALVPIWAMAGNQEFAEGIAAGLRDSGQLHDYKIGFSYPLCR